MWSAVSLSILSGCGSAPTSSTTTLPFNCRWDAAWTPTTLFDHVREGAVDGDGVCHTADPLPDTTLDAYVRATDFGSYVVWGGSATARFYEVLRCVDGDGQARVRVTWESWSTDDGWNETAVFDAVSGSMLSLTQRYLSFHPDGMWCCGEAYASGVQLGPDLHLTCSDPYDRSDFFGDTSDTAAP